MNAPSIFQSRVETQWTHFVHSSFKLFSIQAGERERKEKNNMKLLIENK